MKNLFKLFFIALVLVPGMSSAMTIECGDTNEAYIDMDLSDSFKADYLSEENKQALENAGLEYLVAGRNCGLESWESNQTFEVLFAMEKKRIKDYVEFGPFDIRNASIQLDAINMSDFRDGDVIVAGDSADSLSGVNIETSGSAEMNRGKGQIKIIIRKEVSRNQ